MSEPPEIDTGPSEAERLLARLRGKRARARLAILFEALWPALWPPLGIVGLFVCAALLGIPQATVKSRARIAKSRLREQLISLEGWS